MSRRRYEHHETGIQHMFWWIVGLFAVHALSYIVMPVAASFAESHNSNVPLLLVGCMFWGSIILGYVLVLLANKERKKLMERQLYEDIPVQRNIGAITFFSNVPAAIADAALCISIVAFAGICCSGFTNHYMTYVTLTVISFSLNMHGMFNGRIYKTTKCKRLRRVENHE